jgi:hypothetical protein
MKSRRLTVLKERSSPTSTHSRSAPRKSLKQQGISGINCEDHSSMMMKASRSSDISIKSSTAVEVQYHDQESGRGFANESNEPTYAMIHWVVSHWNSGKKTNDIKLATELVNSFDHNLRSITSSTPPKQIVRLSKIIIVLNWESLVILRAVP